MRKQVDSFSEGATRGPFADRQEYQDQQSQPDDNPIESMFRSVFGNNQNLKKSSLHYDSFDLDANLERLRKIKEQREKDMATRLEKAQAERREYLTQMFF